MKGPAQLTILTTIISMLCPTPGESYWKFPGLLKHDNAKSEDSAFGETMKELLQFGDDCNVQENENLLQHFKDWLKNQNSLDTVKSEFTKKGKGLLCRYDLTVCDETETKCLCNTNAEEQDKACRIKVGWPCTEGEGEKPNQCVKEAACKPWEGSFNYDTETFPTVSDFFTDAGTYYCRCNNEEDADCGGAGDSGGRNGKDGNGGMSLRENNSIIILAVLLSLLRCIASSTEISRS